VTAPGPFDTWAAVGWLKNLNLSLQCDGSGVDWQSGNGLTISDSVIQGWGLFGVRVGLRRGGYGGFVSENVYYEAGPSCESSNPYGNVGLAGIINQGGQVSIKGTAANGVDGMIPNWGAASGSQMWLYWVVPVSSLYGDGVPLPAGYAYTNGTALITGTFPRVAGASSYKILKIVTDGTGQPYPYGTGSYLLTSVAQSFCAAHSCQFTDSGQTLSSYTNVGASNNNIYLPMLDFWPGTIIMGQAGDTSSASYSIFTPNLTADVLGEGDVVSTLPASIITGQAQTMVPTNTPVVAAAAISATNTNGSVFPGATVLKAFNSPDDSYSGYKGRLNFGPSDQPGGFSPIITLGDSNWGKTWSTPNQRPTADPGDIDLGYEGTINTFYERAANEIRNYIGKLPDGSPQESLTSAAKTINVPVTINGNLTLNGSCSGCGSPLSLTSSGPFSLTGSQVTDNFSGSNGVLSANWTVTDGTWVTKSSTAQCVTDGPDAHALAAYTASSFSGDQYSQATVVPYNPPQNNFAFIGVGVRLSSSTSTGYVLIGDTAGTIYLSKLVNGTSINLGTANVGLAAGDVILLTATGPTLIAYKNGVPIITVTDLTVTTGYPGIACNQFPYSQIENFRGGDYTWSSQGTISVASSQLQPQTFASLPTCDSAHEGTQAAVTDSTTQTWGATLTGSGTNHVLGYCDGTSWTVAGR